MQRDESHFRDMVPRHSRGSGSCQILQKLSHRSRTIENPYQDQDLNPFADLQANFKFRKIVRSFDIIQMKFEKEGFITQEQENWINYKNLNVNSQELLLDFLEELVTQFRWMADNVFNLVDEIRTLEEFQASDRKEQQSILKSFEDQEKVKMEYQQILAEEKDKFNLQLADLREQHEQQLAHMLDAQRETILTQNESIIMGLQKKLKRVETELFDLRRDSRPLQDDNQSLKYKLDNVSAALKYQTDFM